MSAEYDRILLTFHELDLLDLTRCYFALRLRLPLF